MEPCQEVISCLNCRTRLTLRGRREPHAHGVTRYEVKCPSCGTIVAFAIRGVLGPEAATLICYERPRRWEGALS
jgi:phage FluMu protein Com